MMKVKILTTILAIAFSALFLKGQDCSILQNSIDQNKFETIYAGTKSQAFLDSLNQIGYYTLRIDSTATQPCRLYISKGKQFKKVLINSTHPIVLNQSQYDTIQHLYYTMDFEQLIEGVKDSLLYQGQAFDEINIKPNGFIGEFAQVDISIKNSNKRQIDEIKFIGYEKVPKFVIHELLKNNKIYNDQSIDNIRKKLDEYAFLNQTDTPRISFTKDSTILYVYTKKLRQNFINGILGFETDEDNKLNLQGNVQLNLVNTFNYNERINVDWKSGLNKSQKLRLESFIPNIFKNKIAYETNLNLTKQDSTYFKLEWRNGLFYQLNQDHYIGANYSLANSNYIKNDNSDFKKRGFGFNYIYEDFLFNKLQENKTWIKLSSTLWNRNLKNRETEESQQTEVSYWIERQQRLYKNHFVNSIIQGNNLIQQGEILENDLYQIGGFNSIRGFNQNSILTPSFNAISLAYRYIPNNNIFFEVFSDLALIEDKLGENTSFFNSYGLGMQFSTNFGWFQLNYALGSNETNSTNLTEGKIHIGIKSYF